MGTVCVVVANQSGLGNGRSFSFIYLLQDCYPNNF